MLPHSEMLFWFSAAQPEEKYSNHTFLNMVADECLDIMPTFEQSPLHIQDLSDDEEYQKNPGVRVLLRGDIMWSTASMTKSSNIITCTKSSDSEMEIESQIFVPPKSYFNCISPVPESANLVNYNNNNNNSSNSSNTFHMTVASYTPDYDHSYNKPKSEEVEVKVKEEKKSESSAYEESESDESSGDDEIDIETVSDDGQQKMCAIRLQRTLRPIRKPRKRYISRENILPLKLKNGFCKQETTRVIASMLKRTKQYHQSRKSIVRTKRSHRPANSLPCSPGSSRSNSDTEEPVVKRSMHNNMERMRRNQQRMALHCLRDKIPELRNNSKVSKVKIINKAKEFIQSLRQQEQEQEELLRRLSDRNMMLRKRLELYRPNPKN